MKIEKAKDLVSNFSSLVERDSIIGWGPSGSRMYGLHNDDSDYDWFIVVDSLNIKNEIHHQVGEDDVWITDAQKFVRNISKAIPNYVDFLLSTETQWDKDHPLYPYVVGTPVNLRKYSDNLRRHITSDLHTLKERGTMQDRDKNMMKTAVRNAFQKYKADRYSLKFTPFRVQFGEYEKLGLLDVVEFLLSEPLSHNYSVEDTIEFLEDNARVYLG